jgi:hypothetical protein
LRRIKSLIKKTPAAIPFIYLKGLITQPHSQNDEAIILDRLLNYYDIPKTFVEFGFGGWEFNCATLVRTWEGLLIDGDPYNVKIAKTVFPKRIKVLQEWITLETLSSVHDYARGRDLGILSVDVDGNDYWFLENLIVLKPAIIIAEYNAVFGLKPITVPYDPNFDYTKFPVTTYYGASLTALHHLATKHGYSLVEVGLTGVNCYFVRNDLLGTYDRPLQPEHSYREKTQWGERPWYGKRNAELWEDIKDMPYVDVTQAG